MEKPLPQRKRSSWVLLLGLLLLFALAYFIYSYSPESNFPSPIPAAITPIIVFFLLLFLSVACMGSFLFNHKRRGILLGVFVCSYLLLQLNHLSEFYFLFLLGAVCISLELFFTRYH